jgi:hypothetical protein
MSAKSDIDGAPQDEAGHDEVRPSGLREWRERHARLDLDQSGREPSRVASAFRGARHAAHENS